MKKLFLMAVIFTAAFASCKKDNAPKPNCRIITATQVPAGLNSTYNLTYNSEGKLSTVTAGDETTVYVYSGSTIIENSTISGIFNSKKIITLNANGLAANVRTEEDEAGAIWDNYVIEYNGTEILKDTYTTSEEGGPSIETYTWSGGNLVTIRAGTNTVTLEYYTDKPSQTGDYFNYKQLTTGYESFRTKNALKTKSDGSYITNYDYSFDADGKIISMILTETSTVTYYYQYQCK